MDAGANTEARYELRRMVRNDPPWLGDEYPPWIGHPNLEKLFNLLPPRSLIEFVAKNPPGITFGEVGLVAPNGTTRHFDDGSVLIVVTSGLIQFMRAVTFTLMEGFTTAIVKPPRFRIFRRREYQAASMPPKDVDASLIALYQQWQMLWSSEGRFEFPDIRVKPQALDLGAKIFDLTILFLLFHEIGHAALHGALELDDRKPDNELEADHWGLEALLRYFAIPRGEYMNLALVGAVLAVRLLAALEAIGHKFPISYPPPSKRFAAIMAAFGTVCDSEWTFYFESTIAFAIDQRMEATENAFRGLPPPHVAKFTVDRFVSGAMSALKLAYQQSWKLDVVRRMLAEERDRIPQNRVREVSEAAARVFNKNAPHYSAVTALSSQENRLARETKYVVDTFWKLMPELRLVFRSATDGG
jgi:hypothetical protein